MNLGEIAVSYHTHLPGPPGLNQQWEERFWAKTSVGIIEYRQSISAGGLASGC